MKRESGVSPGQSRCCVFQEECVNTLAPLFFPGGENGKAMHSETSQKTCKAMSENLLLEEAGGAHKDS